MRQQSRRRTSRSVLSACMAVAVVVPLVCTVSVDDSALPFAVAQVDGAQEGPRGGAWQDEADPAMTHEDRMRIQEQERRQRELEREEAYLQRLEDLGVGQGGGSSSSDDSGDDADEEPPEDTEQPPAEDDEKPESDESGKVNGDFAEPMVGAADAISSHYKSPDRPGHKGIDIAKPDKEAIFAVTSGTVVAAGPATGFGNWVVIDHQIDGKKYSSVYGHMRAEDVLVKVGDQVDAGHHIANEGSEGESTGPHLHFEVWDGGRLNGGTEIDPTDWAKRGA